MLPERNERYRLQACAQKIPFRYRCAPEKGAERCLLQALGAPKAKKGITPVDDASKGDGGGRATLSRAAEDRRGSVPGSPGASARCPPPGTCRADVGPAGGRWGVKGSEEPPGMEIGKSLISFNKALSYKAVRLGQS